MQIDKQQIIALLTQQGDQAKAQQAEQELPNQVDTDDAAHLGLLERLGVDPMDLVKRFMGGGLGL